jgi:hypothetical protein
MYADTLRGNGERNLLYGDFGKGALDMNCRRARRH